MTSGDDRDHINDLNRRIRALEALLTKTERIADVDHARAERAEDDLAAEHAEVLRMDNLLLDAEKAAAYHGCGLTVYPRPDSCPIATRIATHSQPSGGRESGVSGRAVGTTGDSGPAAANPPGECILCDEPWWAVWNGERLCSKHYRMTAAANPPGLLTHFEGDGCWN